MADLRRILQTAALWRILPRRTLRRRWTLLLRIVEAGQTEAAVVSAATAVLDRAWGRPRQDMGVELAIGAELASKLEEARRRARGE